MAMPPITGPASELNAQYQAALAYLEAQGVANLLISTGAILIGGDSDASGTDGVSLQTRGVTRLLVNNDGTLTAPGTKLTLGDSSIAAGARIDLTAAPNYTATAGRKFNWWSQTFGFTNGPGGETNYDDDEQQRSYNRSNSGAKTVAGIKDFGWADEVRFYTGTAFQSEHYFDYRNPAGTLQYRPWIMLIDEIASTAIHSFTGDIYFNRNPPNHATQTAFWHEDGALDMSLVSTGSITLPNNQPDAIRFKNAAGSATVPVAYVNASDQVVFNPGGGTALLTGNLELDDVVADRFVGKASSDLYISDAGSNFLQFYANGTKVFELSPFQTFFSNKHVCFEQDNTYDFGYQNATNNRPRDVHVGRDIYLGGVLVAGSAPTTLTDAAGKVLPAAIGSFSTLSLVEGGVINWDSGDLTLTQAGNVLTMAGGYLNVTGPASSLTLGPKVNFMFDSDVDAALSYLIYSHDNLSIAFDAWFNGTNWTSSDAGSNFALYKVNDTLAIGFNAGTAKAGTFAAFDTTTGVIFSATGRMGIGGAPGTTAKLYVSDNVGIGTTTFGTSAAKVLSLLTGTAPSTGPADTVQFYSSDDAAGHTIPSFFCEGTNVVATGQADSASSVRVKMRINGVVRTFLCI